MKQSPFFSINWKDLGKGIILAFLTVFVAAVYQSISAGALPTLAEIKADALAGAVAAIAYLLKNLLTNSQDQFVAPEPKKSDFPNISKL